MTKTVKIVIKLQKRRRKIWLMKYLMYLLQFWQAYNIVVIK